MSLTHHKHIFRRCLNLLIFIFLSVSCSLVAQALADVRKAPPTSHSQLEYPFILTQLPPSTALEQKGPIADGMLRADYGDRARLIIAMPDSSTQVISQGFYSACDPEISFDASHILFAGKKTPSDNWNIFEMTIDGTNVRQVTRDIGDCRSPCYQATLYTIVSPKPWYQLTFVSSEGYLNEYGGTTATSLYSCKLDGSAVRRLTYNLSSDIDPFIMPDGRLLFASWQRSMLNRGIRGRIALFAVNIDGTDYAAFSTDEGKRIKHMPCITTKGLAVFVEADSVPWDGAGSLACVNLRRPLHSYQTISAETDGLFHSPSPLPDGNILVSRRLSDNSNTHGVYRLDPFTGRYELIFDSLDFHDIQANAVYPRPEPDGRSSVVTEEDHYGKLYCLNVYTSDLERPEWMPHGTVKRLRVLEGVPLSDNNPNVHAPYVDEASGSSGTLTPALVPRRILGEIDVNPDGSFNIEIPANTPIQLQILDSDGMALRSCGWIWAKNHEPRGCIGCHEDGELTPENILVDALTRSSIKLTLPPERRRTVEFRRDIMPIIAKNCVQCHSRTDSSVPLTSDLSSVTAPGEEKHFVNRSYQTLLTGINERGYGKYVHPGTARTSRLIWLIFGRKTSRPWDNSFSQKQVLKMPPDQNRELTDDEKRTFIEWIDMGALWNAIPTSDKVYEKHQNSGDK
jgi:hypothetical protein